MKKPESKRKLASVVLAGLMLTSMLMGMVSADVDYTIAVAVTTTTVSDINYATFTATKNGAAKENVEIYIDELFMGVTDTSGTYVGVGLTDGTHEWKAKYRGATYDSGSFAFFNYTITAKGTSGGGEPWSATETGKASVSSQDTDKLLIKSSLVAPNADTTYSVTITVDGKNYDADVKSDIGIAKGHTVMAWTVGNELHATMKAAGKEDHFFDYDIPAKGERSPPKSFDYKIIASGTEPKTIDYTSYKTSERVADHRDIQYFDWGRWTNQDVHEYTMEYNFPKPFVSTPTVLSYSSNGVAAANPWWSSEHTNYCWLYSISTTKIILKTFAFEDMDGAGWHGTSNPSFSCRVTGNIPWSEQRSGSNVVKVNGDKPIESNLPTAPNGDTTYTISLTVDGQTHTAVTPAEAVHIFPPDALEERWLKLRIENKRLYASTNYFELWSDAKSGSGSVNSSEIVKTIDTYDKPVPPYANTEKTIYPPPTTTVNSTTYKDFNDDTRVECGGFNAWVGDRTLYASVGYLPPVAIIDSISPKLTAVGEKVSFEGHGEPGECPESPENPAGISPVIAYRWRSSKDGTLSGEPDFNTSTLSPARHVIFFKVEDEDMIWSPEVIDSIRVNKPPTAYISSIKGTGIDANGYPTLVLGDSITFKGVGIDTDGYIAVYEWRSDISGLLSTSDSFSISDLPIGYHTIYFRVEDNDGAWSKEVAREFVVRRTPVVYVDGYTPTRQKPESEHHPGLLDPLGNKDSCNLRLKPGGGDIIEYANMLSDEVEILKRNTGAKKVDIVAHSMGGLISRWYIQKGYRNDVRKFISIGSPHHGSDLAYIVETPFFILDWITGGAIQIPTLRFLGGEAAAQMIPHSPFLKSLNEHNGCASTRGRGTDHINQNVQYSVIAGSYPGGTLEHKHLEIELFGIRIIDFIVPWSTFRGDSVVTANSAKLDGAEYTPVACLNPLFVIAHQELGIPDKRRDIYVIVREILLDDLLTIQNTAQCSTENFEKSLENTGITLEATKETIAGKSKSSAEENVSTAFHWSEPILDTIYPGETKSHTTLIDPTVTNASFTLMGLCGLDLALYSPSGVVINPFDPDINYTKEGGYVSYDISNPESGDWTLEVAALNVSESGCNYSIMVFMETNLFVGVGTDKKEYKPNDPIKIYAYVQDDNSPLGNAIVTAEINKSDGNAENISLFDDGVHDDGEANDGIYANTYNNTSVCGAYGITVNATIIKDSGVHNRRAWTTAWVELLPDLSISDTDISFSNTYPEHGDPITITARIHNIGDGDAKDAKILFFDGDPAESDIAIGEKTFDVNAGNISDVSVQWNATYGNHTIHVIISPFNGFLEKNYTNNRACANITVGDTVPPVANAGPDQIVLLNTNVFFAGGMSTDNVGIVNYTWDTDTSYDSNSDGIPDNDVDLTDVDPVLVYGYNTTGTFTVKLSVNDAACNGPVNDTMVVEVTTDYDIEYPLADAGNDQMVTVGEPVLFNGSKSEDNFGIATYFWDTDTSIDADGDDIPDDDVDLIGVNPTFKSGYLTHGVYTVQLTVDDAAGNGPVTDTMTVTVKTKPDLFMSPDDVISTPPTPMLNQEVETNVIIHNGGDTDVKDAKVEFWLNGVLKESIIVSVTGNSNVTATFNWIAEEGGLNTINIKLDPDNQIDEEYENNNEIVTYVMVIKPPVADANGPYTGIVGSPITFDGSKSYDPDGTIVSYEWDLNDDGEFDDATGPTPSQTWNAAYSGNISLKVTDNDEATDIDNTTLSVDAPPTIISVTLDAYTTIPDATIHVTVEATDNIGVSSVTADGINLIETGDIWEGDITAPSATDGYTLAIRAEDTAGNFAETTVEYSVVTPIGGLGVGISPRSTTASGGGTINYNIIISSTENFDDTIHVYVSMDRLPDNYKLNITAFDWVEQDVQIRAGENKELPLVVTIPAGETGRKVFRIKAESTCWISKAYDSVLITTT